MKNNLIKFRFQLNAQYFIPIVMPLYMFRAPLHNYWNKILCIKLEPEFNHYQDARSTTHKDLKKNLICCDQRILNY